MHSRIYLIGFMASGKTTNGKKIAGMMGYDFIDMDHWIEEQEGSSVAEIFKIKGEDHFRKCETAAILELTKKENCVISTGGGAPCHGKNMQLLNNSGLTIYLKLPPAALLSRLKKSYVDRPLMKGKSDEEMLQTIEEMLNKREAFYNQAAMIIDGLDMVSEHLVNAIQRS